MADRNASRERRSQTGAIERLYMMYFAGALLLLLAIIVLTFFTTGRLREHANAIGGISDRLTLLQAHMERAAAGSPGVELGPTTRPARGERPNAATTHSTHDTSAQPTPTTQPASAPSLGSAEILRRVGELSQVGSYGLYALADESAAREFLEQAAGVDGQSLNAPALVALAILARLTGEERVADRYRDAARNIGGDSSAYDELAARSLLAASRPAEAELYARALAENPGRRPTAAVLGAATFAVRRNLGAAREAMRGAGELSVLAAHDRLLAGRVLVALENWDDLQRALAGLDNLPEDLAYERDLLRGVWLIHNGSLPEADATLWYLLEQNPRDYDVMMWRGVVLLRMRQFEAARGTLASAADLSPGRPEAWYWLGMTEIAAGNAAAGRQYLNNALAASASFAAAWEALGAVALNDGDADTALSHLRNAVRHDPGRANAHFLIAVAHAKRGERQPAADALRSAFAWSPGLIEQAKATEVIANLFTAEELQALARPGNDAGGAAGADTP
jgi:Flp pilus assembly protein TadD